MGEGRAGKTATCKSLLGQPFDPNEKSTIGGASQNIRLDAQTAKNFKKVENTRELMRTLAAAASSSDGKANTRKSVTVNKVLKQAPAKQPDTAEPIPPQDSSNAAAVAASASAAAAAAAAATAPDTSTQLPSERPFEIKQLYDKVELPNDDSGNGDHILYSVWDFAGQSVFYDMVNILMTRCVKFGYSVTISLGLLLLWRKVSNVIL